MQGGSMNEEEPHGGNRLLKCAEGLQILARYDASQFSLCAEHDEIHAGYDADPESMTERDRHRLGELGWYHHDGEGWVFYP